MNLKKIDQTRQRVVHLRQQINKMIEDFGPESTLTEAELLNTINQYRQTRSTFKKLKAPNPPRKP